ncbi:MAG: hypothetical protein ACJAT7_002715 [Psychromonas sp.]|jgi:hypothetical protein|uniref:hypothetical protein n=1 Tax=Psychromonas sp. TaxID=1884585 RepID=UPI0039E69E3B
MPKKTIAFEYEKETKNSVRYKEVPEPGQAPIVGSLYVQKCFAGNCKNLQVSIEKKE